MILLTKQKTVILFYYITHNTTHSNNTFLYVYQHINSCTCPAHNTNALSWRYHKGYPAQHRVQTLAVGAHQVPGLDPPPLRPRRSVRHVPRAAKHAFGLKRAIDQQPLHRDHHILHLCRTQTDTQRVRQSDR